MSEGWLDSAMQVVNQRIKSPLWGFIILAWIWFNWPNLAMLFMSDAPVKFRIDYILSQEHFYLRYALAPVFFGSLLAVITPYAQWLLSHAQKWATDRHRENIYLTKEREYKDSIGLSGLKVQADRAVEIQTAKMNANIQEEIERGKRESLKTDALLAKKEQLEASIETLRISLENGNSELAKIRKECEEYQEKLDLIVAFLSDSLESNTNESPEIVLRKAKEIIEGFSKEEIKSARTIKEFLALIKKTGVVPTGVQAG